MITYKIRDNKLNKTAYGIFPDTDWQLLESTIEWPEVVDQSRYTIEREISDDVIYNMRDEYTTTSKWWNWWKILLEIFRGIIKKHLS